MIKASDLMVDQLNATSVWQWLLVAAAEPGDIVGAAPAKVRSSSTNGNAMKGSGDGELAAR